MIEFGDKIDISNVDEILLNQFTLEIDNQIVAINDITTDVNNEYIFNFHTDESFNLHSLSEKVVFTYLPDDNENVRIKDEFGQTHDQGYGVTIYEVFDNGQDYQHTENTMLIFTNYDDNAHVTITGGDHNDSIHGGQADETLIGGAGDDVITGKIGDDILTGGDGRDIFFYVESSDTGSDIITDFELGEDGDIIDLACISTETDIPQRLSFDYIDNTGEIVLGIFTQGNDAQEPGATPNSIITIQSMDDLSLVTLESLRATDQLIVGG